MSVYEIHCTQPKTKQEQYKMIRSFKARLNSSIFRAPRITWYSEEEAEYARIMAKSAMNNKKDGRAIYTLG